MVGSPQMLRRTSRRTLLAWLLSAFVWVSAIDQLPDPPALAHRGPDIRALCVKSISPSPRAANWNPVGSVSFYTFGHSSFVFRHICKVDAPVARRSEIRKAAD